MNDRARSRPRQRGLLDQFIARSTVLVGIYLIINIIYQQSYLGFLGLHIGVWSIASTLPLLNDFLVTLYAFTLWAIITRIPDGWYHHVAEIANPATWRDKNTFLTRLLCLSSIFVFFLILNTFHLFTLPSPPLIPYSLFTPTAEFFSWRVTAVTFLIVFAIVSLLSIRSYSHIRHQGLNQLSPAIRRRMRRLINVGLPGSFLLGFITLLLVLPSWYGGSRSRFDLNRLINYHYQEVQRLDLGEPLCDLDFISEGTKFIWTPQNQEVQVHYLGKFLGEHLLTGHWRI